MQEESLTLYVKLSRGWDFSPGYPPCLGYAFPRLIAEGIARE